MSAKRRTPVVSPSSGLATAAVVQCLLISSLLLFLLPLPSLVISSTNPEVEALGKQKQTFGNPAALSNWNTGLVDPCSWSYIGCDDNKMVQRIDILSTLSRGSLDPALGNLSSLQHLKLSGNGLTGPIPAALGNLKILIELDLSNNSLSGSIPQELSKLKTLYLLWLNDNLLSGEVPQSLLMSIGAKNFSGNPELTGLPVMTPPGPVIMPPPTDSGSNSIPPKRIGWVLVITTIYAGI